jgi:hypothetical protein
MINAEKYILIMPQGYDTKRLRIIRLLADKERLKTT